MKTSLFRGIAAMMAISAVAVTGSCSEQEYEDLTTPPRVDKNQTYAPYTIDWTEAADSCSTAFIERFFCDEPRNGSRKGVFSYTEYNNNTTGNLNNGNNYWQQAHCMAAMVDYFNRVKNSNADEKKRIEAYMKDWFTVNGNNYEGNSDWRGSTGFGNDFTDDTCWIIIALLQMYDATGEVTYYDAAKETWDECIRPRFELTTSGWLPWKWTDLGPNECTNGPAAICAAMLSKYSQDAGNAEEAAKYLAEAQTCFDQNIDVMNSDGTLAPAGGAPLSYTQGTCMEAGRLIWHLTGDEGYLKKAILAGRGQMNSGRMNELYNGEWVARDEGADENNSIFKAVMFHWFARMILDTEVDSFDGKIRKELRDYLYRHASYYWANIDKRDLPEGEYGGWKDAYFGVKCYQPRSAENGDVGGSQGAYASAAQCIEAMCMIKDVQF